MEGENEGCAAMRDWYENRVWLRALLKANTMDTAVGLSKAVN